MITSTRSVKRRAGLAALALVISSPSVAEQVASSVGDFSGVQGQGGWRYGYYDLTADPDDTYTTAEFMLFPADYWTGELWDWPDGNPPWTQFRAHSAHPSGAPGTVEHWAIRRWTSAATRTVEVCGRFAKVDDGGGNGTTCRIFVDDEEVFVATIGWNDTDGITFDLEITVVPGTSIDFVVDSLGTDGSRNTLFDSTRLSVAIFTACRGDIDGNGASDFEDLLAILSAWGPCDGCAEDLGCDGSVNFDDLLAVLATWGPCSP